MPKPFQKSADVVPIKPGEPAKVAPHHVLGASGAMRRADPPRLPLPEWPSSQPSSAWDAPRRVNASDLAARVAERDAYNTRIIAQRMEREREALALSADTDAPEAGTRRTLAMWVLASAAIVGGLAWWVLA